MVAVRSHTANFTVDVGTVCNTFNKIMLYFNLSSRLKMPGLWSSSRCIFKFNGSGWISKHCGFMEKKKTLTRKGGRLMLRNGAQPVGKKRTSIFGLTSSPESGVRRYKHGNSCIYHIWKIEIGLFSLFTMRQLSDLQKKKKRNHEKLLANLSFNSYKPRCSW